MEEIINAIKNSMKKENDCVQSMHGTFSEEFLKGYASCYSDLIIELDDILSKLKEHPINQNTCQLHINNKKNLHNIKRIKK